METQNNSWILVNVDIIESKQNVSPSRNKAKTEQNKTRPSLSNIIFIKRKPTYLEKSWVSNLISESAGSASAGTSTSV